QGKLRLGPTDRVITPELPFDISERTLEAFVSLPVTNQKSGVVMQIEQGDVWDGIIFSDFTPGRWTPGSSFRHRSTEFDIPEEPAGPADVLQLATVYARDNSIMLYRNGNVLGGPFTPQGPMSSLQTYRKGEARIVFGRGIVCDLIEARLYDRALTWKEIATSYKECVRE
ncbi:MAG: LamG domain-containing protein, partial [Gemmataceae bacterium]|nr:LamG domain-containing protein [Gemmataceae bacterium]